MNKFLKTPNITSILFILLFASSCVLVDSKKKPDNHSNSSDSQSTQKDSLSLLNDNMEKSKSKDESISILKEFKQKNPDKAKIESELKNKNASETNSLVQSNIDSLKKLRSDFKNFFADSKNSEQKFGGLSSGEIIDLINSIIDILNGIDVIKDDKNFIIGSKACGTLEVNNENIHEKCDEVRRIAECVRSNCQAPEYTLILCSEDPSLEICKLNSLAVCNVEPGMCKAITDTEQKIIDDLKDQHDLQTNPLLNP